MNLHKFLYTIMQVFDTVDTVKITIFKPALLYKHFIPVRIARLKVELLNICQMKQGLMRQFYNVDLRPKLVRTLSPVSECTGTFLCCGP